MATRPEVLQWEADFLGESFVTLENHARSMNSAPGRLSTVIGRGNRNVDQDPDYILSVYLAALINEPKNAAIKVPKLADLKQTSVQTLQYSVRFESTIDLPPETINKLFSDKITEEKRFVISPYKRLPHTLFDFLHLLIKEAGEWQAGTGDQTCPVPDGFNIKVTLGNSPQAEVSFRTSPQTDAGSYERVEYFYRDVNDSEDSDTILFPFKRMVEISRAHILLLGKIYADTLIKRKARASDEGTESRPKRPKSKNEKADNPARSPASSETLSHDGPGTTTGTARKTGLHKSDPSARVCVESRGFSLKGLLHEHASYHHAVL